MEKYWANWVKAGKPHANILPLLKDWRGRTPKLQGQLFDVQINPAQAETTKLDVRRRQQFLS